jgi:hypothetical protein
MASFALRRLVPPGAGGVAGSSDLREYPTIRAMLMSHASRTMRKLSCSIRVRIIRVAPCALLSLRAAGGLRHLVAGRSILARNRLLSEPAMETQFRRRAPIFMASTLALSLPTKGVGYPRTDFRASWRAAPMCREANAGQVPHLAINHLIRLRKCSATRAATAFSKVISGFCAQ